MQCDYDDLAGTCAAGPVRSTPFRPAAVRTGKPVRVILDLTTPLEAATGGLAVAAFVAVVYLAVQAYSLTGLGFGREWIPAFVALFAFVMFGWAWRCADCYYVIDGKQKKFLYHFSFLGVIRENVVTNFEGIKEITVDATEKYAKRKHGGYYYWVYALMVVLRDGTRIRVSDEIRDEHRFSVDGCRAADVVGCGFTEEGKVTPYSFFGSFFR